MLLWLKKQSGTGGFRLSWTEFPGLFGQLERWSRAFVASDANRDGCISLDELSGALQLLHLDQELREVS